MSLEAKTSPTRWLVTLGEYVGAGCPPTTLRMWKREINEHPVEHLASRPAVFLLSYIEIPEGLGQPDEPPEQPTTPETTTISTVVYEALVKSANTTCREGLAMENCPAGDTFNLVVKAEENRQRFMFALELSLDDATFLLKLVKGVR